LLKHESLEAARIVPLAVLFSGNAIIKDMSEKSKKGILIVIVVFLIVAFIVPLFLGY